METEDQQVEELKKWWKENGSSIITGVVLGLAVLFGAKSWFAYQERIAKQASGVYTLMMTAIEQGENTAASAKAGILITDFSSTPYASLAAMALAKFRAEDGDLEAARTQLQWVLDSGSGVIRDTARLRLARILIDLQEYDEAMTQLDKVEASTGQDGILVEVRGDIHSVRGEVQQAVGAYQSALALMGPEYSGRYLVQLKYDYAATLAAPATAEGPR
jgi:predicted negative regulator of RcsB-dependent stress response